MAEDSRTDHEHVFRRRDLHVPDKTPRPPDWRSTVYKATGGLDRVEAELATLAQNTYDLEAPPKRTGFQQEAEAELRALGAMPTAQAALTKIIQAFDSSTIRDNLHLDHSISQEALPKSLKDEHYVPLTGECTVLKSFFLNKNNPENLFSVREVLYRTRAAIESQRSLTNRDWAMLYEFCTIALLDPSLQIQSQQIKR